VASPRLGAICFLFFLLFLLGFIVVVIRVQHLLGIRAERQDEGIAKTSFAQFISEPSRETWGRGTVVHRHPWMIVNAAARCR
jgi:hypothetical protein